MSLIKNTKKTLENLYKATTDIMVMTAIVIGLPAVLILIQLSDLYDWYFSKAENIYSQYQAEKALKEYEYSN